MADTKDKDVQQMKEIEEEFQFLLNIDNDSEDEIDKDNQEATELEEMQAKDKKSNKKVKI